VSDVAPASVPPPRKDRGGEATRQRILQAAEHEFADKGYAGARLAAIARGGDVPQPLIHHYFGDKEGLYRAVLERVLGYMATEGWRILETLAPPKQRPASREFSRRELQALVDAFVGLLVDFYASHAHVLRILRDEALRGGDVGEGLVKTHLRPQLADIVARFEAMKAAGEVRADVDAHHLCISTVAMACFPTMDEAFLGALWGIDPRSPAFVDARKREVAMTVMGRIAP
jgi:TetR/AcrR family transcriptional regulator